MLQILELFGGIGSPRIALRNMGIPVKSIAHIAVSYPTCQSSRPAVYRMASQSRCIRFVAPSADSSSGHMIKGSTMIDKIIGIRRLAWRAQPPKQWKKRKQRVAGGFENVLRETMRNEKTKEAEKNKQQLR